MSNDPQTPDTPAPETAAAEQFVLPPLPVLVMPEIKITDENSVVVAASRLRYIRDQYDSHLDVDGGQGIEAAIEYRQQFRRDIEEVIGLLDRAWEGQQKKAAAAS